MAHKFAQIAFTESVRQVQTEHNSRLGYAVMDQGEDFNYLLSEQEGQFIESRDSFYMASVSETLWPYVQHRGGPKGFMRVLDSSTIGFADFSGNRQYVSLGNFRLNDRVALFFMDYASRRRLKLMGRIQLVPETDWETLAKLEVTGYRARVERGFLIRVEAFDWNCPQHITPRYTEAEIGQVISPVIEENRRLHAALSNRPLDTEGSVLGTGVLPLIITGIRQLTPRIRAYELRHRYGGELPKIQAGAHIRIPVRLANGEMTERRYSICSNPAREDIYEIAVLKEPKGTGGSQSVHDQFHLGMRLNTEIPENYFKLHSDDRPVVLIAGGIGITPIKAMAQALAQRGQRLEIHYAGRSVQEMAFYDRLSRAFGEQLTCYESSRGRRLDLSRVLKNAPKNATFYACGPQKLLDELQQEAAKQGIPADRLRSERFTAAKVADARPFTVEMARSKKRIRVPAEQSVLDAILAAGVEMPYSCKTGECKSCAVKVLQGAPQHNDNSLSEQEKTEQGLMCPCVSRSLDDYLILDV